MRHDGLTNEDRTKALESAITNIRMEMSGIDGIVEMLDRSIEAGYSKVMTEELAKCLLKATSDLMTLAVEVKYNAERIKYDEINELTSKKDTDFRIEDYIEQNKTN